MVKGKYFAGLLVFSIPFLLFLQSVSFEFTNFDDHLIIHHNHAFLSHSSNIPEAFTRDAFCREQGTFYRPLQLVSYIIDLQSGEPYSRLHLTNILLFGLAVFLLYILLVGFSIPWQNAAIGTVMYGVHPLFVSVSTWIPSRGDLLLTIFVLLSFVLLTKYLQKRRTVFLVLHWFAFVFALFSKETAIVLPVLYYCYHRAFYPDIKINKRQVMIAAGYLFVVMLWLWVRTAAIGGDGNNSIYGETGFIAVMGNLRTIPESVSALFIPADIDPIPSFSVFKTISGVLIILFLVLWIIRSKYSSKGILIFGVIWFAVFMAPALVFKSTDTDYLHHRFFLPLQGVLMLLLFLLQPLFARMNRYATGGIALILVVFLSLNSFSASKAYSDPETFYNTLIAENERSLIGYINRGAAFLEKGLIEEAISDYSMAIALKPEHGDLYRLRGNAYLQLKRYDEALEDLNIAVGYKAADAETYNNRGVCFLYAGMINRACSDFQKAAELGSESAQQNRIRYCK